MPIKDIIAIGVLGFAAGSVITSYVSDELHRRSVLRTYVDYLERRIRELESKNVD